MSPQNNYDKLKDLAKHILEQYKDGYIVGSMAIALREEAVGIKPTPYPNDIDIVLPVDQGVATLPRIDGMTSRSGMTTKGATYYDKDHKGLSADIILEKKEPPTTELIGTFKVLNIESLKKEYEQIVDGWEYNPGQQEDARNKLQRLNYLIQLDNRK